MNRRTFLAAATLAPGIYAFPKKFTRIEMLRDSRNHWHTPGMLGSLRHYRGPANQCPYC